jgi:hypothetical protein
MTGIKVFSSLEEAQKAGFVVFDRIAEGYLVRKDQGDTFALAIVKLKNSAKN